MNDISVKKRMTTLGLSAILLLLALSSIGTTLILWYTTSQAAEAVHMNNLYQHAHYLVRAEISDMHEYASDPDAETKEEFYDDARRFVTTLQIVQKDGDVGDYTLVKRVLVEQEQYQELIMQFFVFVDADATIRANTFHDKTLEPCFTRIDTQIAIATDEDYQLSVQSLTHLTDTQHLIAGLTVLVFVVGFIFLVQLWKMMHHYQHQLDEKTRTELVQTKQLALTDPLTGLPNHRTMMDRIEQELAHCQRTQEQCTVVFVDLDHFKHINDTWGHRAGDAVLREAARRLKENIRPQDAVGRYGGEEFVLLLTNTDKREAKLTAERLCAVFAADPCVVKDEETEQTGNLIPVTASIGVAVYQEHGTAREALIEAADRAMYYAKQTGRSRVCIAGEETTLTSQVLTNLSNGRQSEQVTVQTLAAVADIHDEKTSAHARRMVRLAEATTRQLGRPQEEVHLVRLAALFHDIGKIGIPDAILHKPGPLNEEEWTVMRRHPILGQHVLEQVGGIFELLSHIVVAHHERWDGRGYPHKLAQDAIPLGARILAVVDSYDAMTSNRPYRLSMSDADARAELQRCSGHQYDPQVVEAFLQVLKTPEQLPAPVVMNESLNDATASPQTEGDVRDRESVRS